MELLRHQDLVPPYCRTLREVPSCSYELYGSFLSAFRKHLLRHRVDDVLGLYQMFDRLLELRQFQFPEYQDGKAMNFLDVVHQLLHLDAPRPQDLKLVRVVRILDDFALGVHLTLEDEIVQFVADVLLDVMDDELVDEVLHRQQLKRMDYCQHAVGVALQKMDLELQL